MISDTRLENGEKISDITREANGVSYVYAKMSQYGSVARLPLLDYPRLNYAKSNTCVCSIYLCIHSIQFRIECERRESLSGGSLKVITHISLETRNIKRGNVSAIPVPPHGLLFARQTSVHIPFPVV